MGSATLELNAEELPDLTQGGGGGGGNYATKQLDHRQSTKPKWAIGP